MSEKVRSLSAVFVGAVIAATAALFMGAAFAKETATEVSAPTSGDVEKSIQKAIDILSETAERQTERVKEVLDIVKAQPKTAALSALCTSLKNDMPTKRRSAVYIIQMLTWENPAPAFPPLRELLKNQEATTRGMAAMALASQGDTASYEAIVEMLKNDADAYARRTAAWAVGELGDAKGVEPLRAAASDPDPNVAANANNALDRIAFLLENKGTTGDAAKVVRGIFLISGSTLWQEERLQHARSLIEGADAAVREATLAQASKSQSQAIRNSVAFVRQPKKP